MNSAPEIPCPSCGYDLRGLVSLRGALCPECGRRSSYETIREFDRYLPPIRWFWYLLASPLVWMCCAFAAVLIQPYVGSFPIKIPFVVLAVLWPAGIMTRISYMTLLRHGHAYAMFMAPVLGFIGTALLGAALGLVVAFVGIALHWR